MTKKGDTLIEVTLAVGIFSLVAIAIVSVMTGGNSSAQTSLETTLARAEIDAQAEALRFLQTAYISDKNNNEDDKYVKIWEKITSSAIKGSNISSNVTNYTPSTCAELYNDSNSTSIKNLNGFVINTKKLGNFSKSDIEDVIVSSKDDSSSSKFTEASTYPRLIYNSTDSEALVSSGSESNLYRAEGTFIVAVKDNRTTTLSDGKSTDSKQSAYYDFYIRTCWYGPGDETPSTISTVIRLYDPDVVDK